MKKIIFILRCLPVLAVMAFIPVLNSLAQAAGGLHPALSAVAKPGSREGWIRFREGTDINPETLFSDYRGAFGLSANDDMRISRTKVDELGFTHKRYQQYYKNTRVIFGEFIVHQRPDGFVKSANGRLIKDIEQPVQHSVPESQALINALTFMNAGNYLWQNVAMENELKRTTKDPGATYYPKGELVMAPSNFEATYLGKDYRLAWSFSIYTDDPEVHAKTVYVDALTGKVIYFSALSMNCSTGSGGSAYNGTVTIYTQLNGSNYRSQNDCQATDIFVYNCSGGGASNTFYSDGDNSWSAASQQSAVQCQWGAEQTYSYFNGVHARQSWDGASGDMIAYNNAFAGSNNACWGCTGNSTIFYAGSTGASTDDWNTNDIVGHEFTHGVTQAESNLVYEKEPGALNESFSDIFGEMVESWSEGICDYLVGNDRGAIRSFISPNAFNDPDTYLGTNWVSTSCTPAQANDYCGVHTNSGVQNFWFYLLSEGGSGTNDAGTNYNVTGISRFSARAIAYRNNSQYLITTSQYIDARDGSLDAADDLYGNCSNEYIQTGNAWYAVNVGPTQAYYNNNVCGTWPLLGLDWNFKGVNTITGASGCATTISASANSVSMASPNRVTLYPGFIAQAGSHFLAYLDPCAVSYHKGQAAEIRSDAEKGLGDNHPTPTGQPAMEDVKAEPNPFSGSLTVSFRTGEESEVVLEVYDVMGQRVQSLDRFQELQAGYHRFGYSTGDLNPGIYFLEVNLNGVRHTIKLVKTD